MLLAPTLTLNAPARGFDADATAFAAASGATDVAALSTFVKGVKELGLWDDMVCWPLRSTQNAGTGTTAYSLGGLGTFNGTLVNGPTWGADGVTLDGSDDRLDLPTIAATASTLYSVFAETSFASLQGLIVDGKVGVLLGTGGGTSVSAVDSNAANIATFVIGSTLTVNNFASASASFSATSGNTDARLYRNGAFVSSGNRTLTSTDTGTRVGARAAFAQWFFGGTMATSVLFSSVLTDQQCSDFNTLYKQTLGTGLGLP